MTAPAAPPAAPGTSQQHAVRWLRHAIVTRLLRPGERVAQEAVAEQTGVSVVPVREALRVLEGEGQLVYRPRRGYFVAELATAELREIYELRRLLEERAARLALPRADAGVLDEMEGAADECAALAEAGDVAGELGANRRFHFALLEAAAQPHTMRLIRLLWDSTEAYRAIYYNSPAKRTEADRAHRRILAAADAGDADLLVAELDDHRRRALETLERILD